MNVNAGHERTSKARIIHQIQLIRGITSDQLFNARLTGLISVSELKNAVAVTAAKSVMAFRVLTMAVDLCRLTTRTMNVNAGHERTSKARIIHQIQLIRGITQISATSA
ncbi:hypothetical protein Asd1617_04791 [Shigella dysenteriae 1617]|uniref:Uncharacterized protein n=1 Tax=Shigella dysenteriae 1617 TaxID=754093 RepID=A0A0A6ZZR2_SHIDY|nr:hypothetical protein Asd1617_01869 [Shigella dysenteriae 1617]AHA66463.1 hypothetical protein Asd1617_03636 [Shigella dysenteriae 1617]AHA67618.1 hypothetical protein Asd1617_04791 [Shigella dysenteriae 1617]